jgi:hypothetical protein
VADRLMRTARTRIRSVPFTSTSPARACITLRRRFALCAYSPSPFASGQTIRCVKPVGRFPTGSTWNWRARTWNGRFRRARCSACHGASRARTAGESWSGVVGRNGGGIPGIVRAGRRPSISLRARREADHVIVSLPSTRCSSRTSPLPRADHESSVKAGLSSPGAPSGRRPSTARNTPCPPCSLGPLLPPQGSLLRRAIMDRVKQLYERSMLGLLSPNGLRRVTQSRARQNGTGGFS